MRELLLLIAFAPCLAFAQADSSAQKQTIDFTAEIFNGKEHVGYFAGIEGTAYYQDNDWQPGSVLYRDIYYPQVWLKYDLIQKELIVRHPGNRVAITLYTPRIKSFSIAGKKFIRVTENDTTCLSPGIYEEIQKGKMDFYILRSKYLLETATAYGMEREFLVKDLYYVIKDHKCHPVKSKKSIMKLVREKKSAIKADLRKKDLVYRRDIEASLTEIITYYNEAFN
jgi:hypothetical protein